MDSPGGERTQPRKRGLRKGRPNKSNAESGAHANQSKLERHSENSGSQNLGEVEESGFIPGPDMPSPSELSQDDELDKKRRAALRKERRKLSRSPEVQTPSEQLPSDSLAKSPSSETSISRDENAPLLLDSKPENIKPSLIQTSLQMLSPLRISRSPNLRSASRRRSNRNLDIEEPQQGDASDGEALITPRNEKKQEYPDEKTEKRQSRLQEFLASTFSKCRNCCQTLSKSFSNFCSLPGCCVDALQKPLPLLGLGSMPTTAEEEGSPVAQIDITTCCHDDDVLGLMIACADALVEDPCIVHPIIRIHVVNLKTGHYLSRAKVDFASRIARATKKSVQKHTSKAQVAASDEEKADNESNSENTEEENVPEKSDATKLEEDPRYVTYLAGPATTQHELCSRFTLGVPLKDGQRCQIDQRVDYILPVQTRPFALIGNNTSPHWDEEIIINESFRSFLRPETLLLFELVDFGPTVTVKAVRGGEGYHKIAWAFLRPIGVQGKVNIGLRGEPQSRPKKNSTITHNTNVGVSRPTVSFNLASSMTMTHKAFEIAGVSKPAAQESLRQFRLQFYQYQPLSLLSRMQASYRGLNIPRGPFSKGIPQVFLQYLLQVRRKYPSTLTINIGPIQAPVPRDVFRRPVLPTEWERHKLSFADLAFKIFRQENEEQQDAAEENVEETSFMRRQRSKKEACMLPDQLFHRITVGKNGATAICYSPKGNVLAVGCCEENAEFPLKLFDAETAQCLHTFPGHHSIIYHITWTQDERFLLTTSADGTAKLWYFHLVTNPFLGSDEKLEAGSISIKSKIPRKSGVELQSVLSAMAKSPSAQFSTADSIYSLVQSSVYGSKDKILPPVGTPVHSPRQIDKEFVLPHLVVTLQHSPPLYVYCGLFQCVAVGESEPENPQAIALTCGSDHNIHMWDTRNGGTHKGALCGAFTHTSHVNVMVWEAKTGRLYSGDASGTILVWRKTGIGTSPQHFNAVRVVQHPDLQGRAITGLDVHPTRRRGQLLVQAHQNCLRLFDLTTYQLVNQGFGSVNCTKSMIRCFFSPDGRFALSGSEDGKVRVWEAQSGQIIHCRLSTFGFARPLWSLSWHPSQHVIALASYGNIHPVLIYSYERHPNRIPELVDEVVFDEATHKEIEAQERAHQRRIENRQKIREKKEKILKSKLEEAKQSQSPGVDV